MSTVSRERFDRIHISFHPERDDDRLGQGDGRAAVQRHPVAGHADAEHGGSHPRPLAEGRQLCQLPAGKQ